MSSSLSRLRDYFGDELLIPVGRRMEPTALGLSLGPPVRDILQRVRVTIQTRPTFDPATAQRRFRLMTSDYLIEVLLTDVVRELDRIAPGIQLQILPSNEMSYALFQKGDVDLVIVPDYHTVADHPRTLLFDETFSCVLWSGNKFVGDALTMEQWLAMSHVVVHFGRDQLTLLERWFAEHSATWGAERRVDIIAPSFGVVPHLIVGTQRVATMHTSHARLYEKLLPLRVLPAPPDFPIMREMVQWHRHLETDPAIRWLVELLERFGRRGAITDAEAHSTPAKS
jgi:LysR family nod box-dependent transcriptional activator